MNARALLPLLAAILLSAALVALTPDGGDSRDTALAADTLAASTPDALALPPSIAATSEAADVRRSVAVPEAARTRIGAAPAGVSPAAAYEDGESAVRLTAPPFIEQGSSHDVVVAVRVPRGARYVEFTLSANPDLVELREAARGEGSPRGETAFEVSVDEATNRIAIDIEREDGWPQDDTVSMAIVRVEGVGAGSATITASQIVVSDAAGVPMPVASSAASTQLVVMSGPI